MMKRKQNHCYLICSRQNFRSKILNSAFCRFFIKKFLIKKMILKEKLNVFQQQEASILLY